jgi:hypothetical protein
VVAACAIGAGLGVALGGAAFAFWIGTAVSGSNYAEASAQTLPTGATPIASVTPAAGQTVTLTFTQATSSGGTALTAYTVTRYLSGSSTGSAISGGCSSTAGLVTCTDAPGAGTWQYSDAPTIASSNWVGATSAKSTAVVVQALTTTTVGATAAVVVNTAIQPTAMLANATTSPAPSGSISFSVFGPQASAPTTCTGTGWSTVGTSVTVTANGTYPASASYTPTAAGTYWWYASYAGDTYNTASNSGCAATSTVVHLAVTPASLPSATVYVAYSQAISASGGTSPYTFSQSGTLPTGITLSSGGTLAGTISAASQPGSYPITITATDAHGLTGTVTDTLTVLAPTITLSALTNPTGETSDTASVTASGGQATYTYAKTAGTLPTGLSFSSAGAFSGSPSAAGTFAFTLTATDSHGYTGSRSYSLTPVAPTFAFLPTSVPSATVYVAYSQAVTTSGGTGPYTYGETGALPSGLTLSSGGTLAGTVSGANQPGSYPITVTATDADGFSGTTTYTLTVLAPTITLMPTTLPNGALGYSQQVTAAATGNSSDTFTYAITAGALPNGFTMTTGGLIKAGITLTLGTFHFTVTATDANGYTGSRAYTVSILL